MLKWSTRTIDFQLSTTLICALVVRLVLISWGEKIDGNFEVKYTDVDYNVFTDAARLMWDGQSPYDRDTYRYPPLLAFLLIPNMIFASFGKILFSLADIGILWQYFSIVEINPTSTMRGVWISLVWVLNLSFAVISTRGSSDSIHNFLILSVLRLIFMKKYALSGVLLGLSIHLRIYPLIFLPALILYILRPQQLTGRMFWSSQTIEAGDNSAYSTMSANRRILKKSFRICPKFVSTRFELDSRFCVIEYSSDSVWNAIRFFLSACTAFIILTTCAYFLYGWEFLDNAVFYHLKRMDSRHNFSPHFYWLYLTDMTSSSRLTEDMFLNVPVFLSMMTFLPQVLLFSLVTLSMARRDLSACFLLLTFILVAFNKVCTAQYFTWFACFLPVVARVSWGISLKKCVLLFGLWIISLLLWLKCAHSLEFTGTNSFVSIWLGSLIFHIFNVACIILIILISHGVKRG